MSEAIADPTDTSGNVTRATLPKTWGLVVSSWALISLLFIAGICFYSLRESQQSRLDSLSLLHQHLNKRVEDTKGLLNSMSVHRH